MWRRHAISYEVETAYMIQAAGHTGWSKKLATYKSVLLNISIYVPFSQRIGLQRL